MGSGWSEDDPSSPSAQRLLAGFARRDAVVAVIGQGYVGLPEAMAIGQAGFRVIGVDRDPARVAQLRAGGSPFPDVADAALAAALATGAYTVTTDPEAVRAAAVIILCLPTPLDADRLPDLSAVEAALAALAPQLAAPALLVLASTMPPGSTRRLVESGLAAAGRRVGEDVFVGLAPERLDPGNRRFPLTQTPRLVSGLTPACRTLTAAFYRTMVSAVQPVSAPEVAELAKALENTFRLVNVSLVNEVARLCDRLDTSVWEVIDAAASKPFAFLPHYPGPGVGGSCIPVVPQYLRAASAAAGIGVPLVDAALAVNDGMPAFVVEKLGRRLAARGRALAGAQVLVVGVSYKPNVADIRESPARPVLQQLRQAGALVAYHDPLVPSFLVDEGLTLASQPLEPATLTAADAVVLLVRHDAIDRDVLLEHARFIFDTRNALGAASHPKVILL